LFTFAPASVALSATSLDTSDHDAHETTLLHGSPSKKDFLDQIKRLKAADTIDNNIERNRSTDHDLDSYTSTPIVESRTTSMVEPRATPIAEQRTTSMETTTTNSVVCCTLTSNNRSIDVLLVVSKKITSYKSCEIKVNFSMKKLKEKYCSMARKQIKNERSSDMVEHRFNIHIDENQNDEAEDELQRQIDKADFQRYDHW
jgi:hypothetical protein